MNGTSQTPSLLVVEDHPVFRRFLLSWLSRSYRVTAVRDGFEALKWLQAGNFPDAVVLDMEMPRLNGYEFLRNIRYSGAFSGLPVVALSSNSREEVLAKCDGFAVESVFTKPYNPESLTSAIASAVQAREVAVAA